MTMSSKPNFSLEELSIDRMQETDLMQVIRIEKKSFGSPWSLPLFYSELQNPLARYYVARLKDMVVGYVGILVIQEEGQITTIAVHPQYRGHHIGRTLLHFVLVQAANWGLHFVTLEVRESNLVAQKLYRSFGFEVVGKRIGYYSESGEDALLMNSPDIQEPAYREMLGLPGRKERKG